MAVGGSTWLNMAEGVSLVGGLADWCFDLLDGGIRW